MVHPHDGMSPNNFKNIFKGIVIRHYVVGIWEKFWKEIDQI